MGRRRALKSLAGAGLGLALVPHSLQAAAAGSLTKPIPSSGETLPVVGMGSWITFNVGDDPAVLASRQAVLQRFFDMGGGLVDSSPMYGASEAVIGRCLAGIENKQGLFAATKVWTAFQALGISQMTKSEELWGIKSFDLMQIHNLLDWEVHHETLMEWKAEGRVRHIGITTSHGRRHEDFEAVMAAKPLDVVQFTYNILDREAEARLLPYAAERGLAVIANRPFRRGALFDLVAGRPLPGWAAEIACENWAQIFLKFIVSHPAVTCAIPATSRVDHMTENMGALKGPLPDKALRARMIADVEAV